MTYIYGLLDPVTNEVRYIGKSINPNQRYTNHLNDKSRTHKVNWIQSLIKKGLKPKLEILETINDGGDWIERERHWIKVAKEKGWELVNSTDGGDGVLNLSGEGKERMLKTWIGRKHKPETIEKLKQARSKRIYEEKSKDKLSATMKGRKIEWADKLQVAVRKFDDETLSEISKALQQGATVQSLADKYNVHRTTMSKIKAGTYKTFEQKTRNYVKPRRYMQ